MNLTKILPYNIKSYKDKKAIFCKGKKFTYEQFGNRVGRLSNALIKCGISKGKNVGIFSKNNHYFLESYYGVIHTGGALVPLNLYLSSKELAFILKDSDIDLLIADSIFSEKVKDAIEHLKDDLNILWLGDDYENFIASEKSTLPLVNVNEDDIAQIYYTSGTTGRSKGVMLSHKNVYTHALNTIDELSLNNTDVWLHAAPLFHLADAWATWAITLVGGYHVLESNFDPKTICNCIEKQKVTLTNLVPTMYYRLVNFPDVDSYDYSSLRVLMSGGAPISPNLVKCIIDTFKCDYIQTYGMTETSPFLTMSILNDHLRNLSFEEQLKYKATTGRKFKGVELKIVDEKGKEIKNNNNNKDVGEIIVKGDTIFKGY